MLKLKGNGNTARTDTMTSHPNSPCNLLGFAVISDLDFILCQTKNMVSRDEGG